MRDGKADAVHGGEGTAVTEVAVRDGAVRGTLTALHTGREVSLLQL